MSRGGRYAWCRLLVGVLLMMAHLTAAALAENRVVLLLSEPYQAYRDAADAFSVVVGSKYPVQAQVLSEMQTTDIQRLDAAGVLLVPVGVKAMRWVYGLHPVHASILTLMVPRAALETVDGHAAISGKESAVYIDQPFARSLAFIHLLLPDARRVGVIMSDETFASLPAYQQAATRAKFGLVVEKVNGPADVPHALQNLLPKVDVLLMVADVNVVNEGTVRHILLASYRQQIPVIGFSRGLANAGAVAAVVSDPAAIGREGATLARLWNPASGVLPEPSYAYEYALVINYQVARSLGVDVPEDGQQLVRWRKAIE